MHHYSLTSKIESSLMGVQACFDMIMMIRGLMILVFFDGSAAAILASKRNKSFVLSASTRLSDAASRLRCPKVVKFSLNGILLVAPIFRLLKFQLQGSLLIEGFQFVLSATTKLLVMPPRALAQGTDTDHPQSSV